MTIQELLLSEVQVVADYVEILAHRRASGEVTALYSEARDAADTIMYLRNDAPGYLQPHLADVEARCTSLLRSIMH
jgi:hypothetical protein